MMDVSVWNRSYVVKLKEIARVIEGCIDGNVRFLCV